MRTDSLRQSRAGLSAKSSTQCKTRDYCLRNFTSGLSHRVANYRIRTLRAGGLSGGALLFKFFSQLTDSFLLIFADHAQFGDDVCQLFDVLIFDHQVHSILSQALNDG